MTATPARSTASRQAKQGWQTRYAALAIKRAEEKARLLALLGEIADRGLPRPPNTALADRLGLGEGKVRAIISQLVDEGTITKGGRMQSGWVTIVATGRSTAPMKPVPPRQVNSVRGLEGEEHQSAAAAVLDREPCFKCGTRGDIGCVHRPLAHRLPP